MGKQERSGDLVATSLIKRVKGGSGSVMVQASDRRFYVVKSPKNMQHRRTIVNDYLAGSLAFLIGLPTPDPKTIFVRTGLVPAQLDSSPQVVEQRFKTVFGDVCFASLVPANPTTGAIYDCIPLSLWHDVANPEIALGCWLFDCWTNNTDCVQIVIHRARKRRGLPGRYWLTKIDHGYCFEAQSWLFHDTVKSMAYWQSGPASKARSTTDFEPYLTAIQSIDMDAMRRIVRRIPPGWLVAGEMADLDALAQRLVERGDQIPNLLNTWWPTDQMERVTGTKFRIAEARPGH